MPISLPGLRPRSRPETMPARSRPVPVADSQLRLKVAASSVAFATTGGARSTRLWRYGTCQVGLWMPFSQSFTGGRPQAKTNTERTSQGIQAIHASRALRRGGAPRVFIGPADTWPRAPGGEAPRSSSNSHTFLGCQNRSNRTVAAIDTAEATMSTIQGPWKLLTRNWGTAKVTPATRQAGHTSIIPANPVIAQTSQKGTITEKNGSCRPTMAESCSRGRLVTLASAISGDPSAP